MTILGNKRVGKVHVYGNYFYFSPIRFFYPVRLADLVI
jgi:pectate lyase